MISILNQRSSTHLNCEDSVYVHESESFIDGIIADGCSTGTKSHFASQLLCYAFKYRGIKDRYTDDRVIFDVMKSMLVTMAALEIDIINLLSTCMLFHYNKSDKTLYIRVIGDGYYYVNDVEYIVDQNNIPDYLAYHIYDTPSKVREFFNKYPEVVYDSVDRFMICSDGITRIERTAFQPDPTLDPKVLLFKPPPSETYLTRMWNLIKRDGFSLSDDLSIVSYAQDS